MADFRYTPTHFDDVDLTGAAFASVEFDRVNGPAQTQRVEANTAVVVGLGDRFVSQQPEGGNWDVHIIAASRDESHKLTIMQTFSSERGFVYLRANDGNGVNNRVACAVLSLDGVPKQPLHWIARLDVPNTVWEKNTATTTTGNLNAMSGDSATQAVTLAGDRKSRPVLVVDPQAAKGGDPSKDFTIVRRGVLFNRAPLPWNNLPVAISDLNGNPANAIDTTTLTRDNGTTGAVAAGGWTAVATTLDIKAGHGFANGAQFFYIDAEGANDEEQIFGTLTGNQITGAARGIGGTAADTHGEDAVVNKSSMMADGSDMRVYVDGVEVERWVGGIRTATTRVWINADMPAATVLTLRDDITAGATELFIKEGVGALPDRSIVQIGAESIPYTSKDLKTKKLSGLIRGVWVVAALGHSADDAVFLLHHRFVLAFGRYGLGAAPDPIERRPAIDLEQSTNATWYYGDQASDPLTIIHDPDQPGRTGQFIPDFEVDSDDNNNAEPLLLDTSLVKAAWKDSDPTAGKLQVGRLTRRLPQGIKAAVDAIIYDAQPRRSTRLRMLGRDASGQEVVLLDLFDADEGARNGDGLTPAAILHELTMNTVRAWTLGEIPATPVDGGINAIGHRQQKFILDHETTLRSVLLQLKEAGTPDFDFRVQIREYDATDLHNGRKVWAASIDVSPHDETGITAAYVWYEFINSGGDITLEAGTYVLEIEMTGWVSGTLLFQFLDTIHTKHNRFTSGGITDATITMEFGLVHTGPGPIQPEVTVTNQDDESNFDKLILVMNPDQLPFVLLLAAADANVYHASGKWINDDTGDEIALDAWLRTDETLDIDCENRRVLRKESTWEDEAFAAIIPTNPVDWLPFEPLIGGGTNDLSYHDPDMADTDASAVHRDAKV